MKELAETILRLTGSKSKLVLQPLPSDDPKQRNPNISRANTEINWKPKVNLESGLARTIEYFKKIL